MVPQFGKAPFREDAPDRSSRGSCLGSPVGGFVPLLPHCIGRRLEAIPAISVHVPRGEARIAAFTNKTPREPTTKNNAAREGGFRPENIPSTAPMRPQSTPSRGLLALAAPRAGSALARLQGHARTVMVQLSGKARRRHRWSSHLRAVHGGPVSLALRDPADRVLDLLRKGAPHGVAHARARAMTSRGHRGGHVCRSDVSKMSTMEIGMRGVAQVVFKTSGRLPHPVGEPRREATCAAKLRDVQSYGSAPRWPARARLARGRTHFSKARRLRADAMAPYVSPRPKTLPGAKRGTSMVPEFLEARDRYLARIFGRATIVLDIPRAPLLAAGSPRAPKQRRTYDLAFETQVLMLAYLMRLRTPLPRHHLFAPCLVTKAMPGKHGLGRFPSCSDSWSLSFFVTPWDSEIV